MRILEVAESLVGEAAEVAVGEEGSDGALTDIGDTKMLRDGDAEEVVDTIVRNDTIEVVNLVFGRDRLTTPREINGMRDEDGVVKAKGIFELQIPLFTIRVGWILAIRASGWSAFYQGLNAIRRDAQTYLSVA